MRVALKSLYLIVLICVLHAPAFALDSEKPKDSETTEDSEVSSAMDIGIGGGNGSEEPFPHLGDLQSKYSTYQFDVLGDNLAGEHIDIDSGSLSLTNIDISVPGNSALPVQFGRSRSRNGFKASWLGDWVPNIPYISRHYLDLAGANSDRCTGSVYPTPYEVFGPYGSYKIKPESWFEGLSLNIPGKNPGAPGLIFSGSISPEFSGTNARMITKNNWLIKCFASSVNGGDGFTVIAPNGDTYKFEYIKTAFERSVNVGQMLDYNVYLEVLFATEVKDRHGNWVKYDYSSGKLTAIRANDGRQIDFTYSNNRIATATTNNRTWTYSYNGGGELTQVTLPDGRYWGLSTSTHALDPWVASICAFHNSTTVPSAIVRHPSGTTVQFDFTVIMNGRTNADIGIPGRDFESPPLDACFVGGVHSISPTAYYAFSVTKKTVTVPSAGTYVWERNYEQDSGSYSNSSLQLPDTKKRTLTDPNGDKTVFYVNRRNGLLEGTIKKIEVIPSGSNTPIKVTESEYLTGNSIGTDMKSGGVGIAPTGVSTTRIYKTKETITQDGVSYTTDYTFQTTPSASDFAYNEPKRITQSSTLPNVGTRITEYTYTHYKTPWIIALRDTVTRNGKLFEDHSYHSSTGKRLTTKTMGSNFNSLSHLYYSDGTLKSTTNALGKTVTYSNYKRGIAQTISLPENITAYHVVDNNGWVTGFTDGNGVTTGYQYNSVGWLTYIDRVSPWSDTAITYHNLASSSFYQKVVTGAKETVNYFDGLHRLRKVRLRPLYDGGITSYVSYDYDGLSQKTFQSLPSTSSSPTNGTNTTYDALGRVTQIKENFNPYVTISKQYISGNRTRTTDPRGYQTTTSRSGYGSPDDGNITDIVSPEGVTTSLDYDIYGNIETLTQSGTSNGYSVSNTREWSYDSRLRVCRQYTSETGSSVFRYNNIDNVIEYAQGMSGTTGCLSSIPSSSRITNVYDDLGRLDEILYPGSTPDIDLEYDGNSNITRNVRGGVSWDYEYNSAGLLEREDLSIDGRSYYATYNYNGDMAVVSHQSPSGQTVNFYPNGLGQTTTIEKSTNNHQYISNVIYHVNGHVDTYSMANGIDANVNFNSRHLPNRIQALKGATKIIDFGYVYDKSSNVTSITDYAQSGQNRTLTYDGLDRLLTADGPWGSGAFKYDSLGNLREKN